MLHQHSVIKIALFISLSFICNIILAQSVDTTTFDVQIIDNQDKLIHGLSIEGFQPEKSDFQHSVSFAFPSSELNYFNFSKENNPAFNRLIFRQSKTSDFYDNLGAYEHFIQRIKYNTDKFMIDFGIGLLKQNTVLTSYKPNFQATFGTSLEYEINAWLSLYMFGQYLLPINKPPTNLIDPLTYMSPLFIQSEFGSGLRTKHKNIKADFGLKKIFDTQFDQSNPVNSMNTKITIGF